MTSLEYKSLNQTIYKAEHENRNSHIRYVSNNNAKVRLNNSDVDLLRYMYVNLKKINKINVSSRYVSKKNMIRYITQSVSRLGLILDMFINQAEKDYNGIV